MLLRCVQRTARAALWTILHPVFKGTPLPAQVAYVSFWNVRQPARTRQRAVLQHVDKPGLTTKEADML